MSCCACGLLTQLHVYLAANVLHKPLVVEEYGLTWHRMTLDQQRVLFQVGCRLR